MFYYLDYGVQGPGGTRRLCKHRTAILSILSPTGAEFVLMDLLFSQLTGSIRLSCTRIIGPSVGTGREQATCAKTPDLDLETLKNLVAVR